MVSRLVFIVVLLHSNYSIRLSTPVSGLALDLAMRPGYTKVITSTQKILG